MGAIFTQKLVVARWEDFLPWLRQGPGQLVATWLGGDTEDYQAVRYAAPTFILTGNESQGLPPAYAAAAHVRVKMPMLGKATTLHAAVATAEIVRASGRAKVCQEVEESGVPQPLKKKNNKK